MTSLEWCYLAKKFYEFKFAADPLGFYVPELRGMEESLMKCRPFNEDKATMERVGELIEKDVDNRTYETKRRVEAVKIVRANAQNLMVDADVSVEWMNKAMEQGLIRYDEDLENWVINVTPVLVQPITAGDYVVHDLDNGNIYPVKRYMFDENFNKVKVA